MATPVLICDDSNMARKQCARSLPDGWPVDVSFATNGEEGVEAIKEGKAELLLLDLNMPVMDGYEVLEAIRAQDLETMVVVISGDIQPEARSRVKQLGAIDFIKKPVDKEKLTGMLLEYGIIDAELMKAVEETVAPEPKPEKKAAEKKAAPKELPASANDSVPSELDPLLRDCLQELSNVAMGQAGDMLARLLKVFVELPIPNVNLIEVSELCMAFASVEDFHETSGVCQGFIGSGISGEALLILNDSSFGDMAALLNYKGQLDDSAELEVLMDISNILVGAYLKGLAEQLDLHFSRGAPVVLGQHCDVTQLLETKNQAWNRTLAIELSYAIEDYPIKCDLLLFFTEDSIPHLTHHASYLLDD
ncbi:response regulator [Pseudoteredinibacter isoporae]|uniref:CheY-like chemotaxis protein n=1 Tax=Pseudoteredinibacter isoporae TaxID=570281 RepID=A0A7X0JS44_9GAMM|nr:response regulator [Pseudoteredinibacter isoporae]MBB6520331.1 CheY-like chemotaxis protein [Pseudoteredinibacter isoporae]NHO85902.1 response regulator [Pseudoteredinibacter isoporae]NIB25646.1 response regulator [Pseudoteredinibacter isoporae]